MMSVGKSKTKELAKKLGVLSKQKSKSLSSYKYQIFDYICVIDFESTCWKEKRSGQTQEIIEFPSVLLDVKSGAIESEFHHYVQPQESPVLSSFCKEFTGITQDQVDNGIPIGVCLRLFQQWVTALEEQKGIVFLRPETSKCGGSKEDRKTKLAAIATWSDWDLGVCLHYECRRKGIRKASYFNQWIDIRATYKNFYNRKPNGLTGALDDLGMNFEGRQHSGIDDAKNTARLCHRLVQDGCVLKITKNVTNKWTSSTNRDKSSSLTVTAPLSTLKENRPPLYSGRNMLGPTTSLCGNNVGISVCSVGDVVCENGNMDGSLNSTQDSRFLDSIVQHLDFGGSAQSWVDTKPDTDRFKKPLSLPTKRDPTTPLTPVLPPTKVRNSSTIGVESQSPHRVSYLVGIIPDHSWNRTSGAHSSSEQSPRPTRTDSTPLSGQDRVVEPAVITPDTVQTTTFKITPPMCRCGRRTKENTVYKEGPNQGRTFFACSRRNGCGYFEWRRDWSESNNCELYSEYDF